MRVVLALLFIVHGIAHLPGFAMAWQITPPGAVSYNTTVLNGSLDIGAIGIRIVGLLSVLLAAGFVAAGVATFRGAPLGRHSLSLSPRSLSCSAW